MTAPTDESPERRPNEHGLSEEVYRHLRAIARHKLAHEPPGHTLQATALVHEAYMRLTNSGRTPPALDAQFYWAAANAMRRILIEHARAKLYDVVIVDTAGRLAIDEELMTQAADIRAAVHPDEVLLVVFDDRSLQARGEVVVAYRAVAEIAR